MNRSDSGLYARSFADVYDDWYADLHDVDRIASAVTERVGARATILELGSGSGRISGPLSEHGAGENATGEHRAGEHATGEHRAGEHATGEHRVGHTVIALDSAVSMLRRDRSASRRVAGDMAALPLVDDMADAAVIAYNTLFNLATPTMQVDCLAEVARVLRPGGWLAVETFVAPADPATPFGLTVVPHHTDAQRRIAIMTWNDPDQPELITGAHVELGPGGVRSRPWLLAYRSPADLEVLAESVGLTPAGRYAGWDDSEFDPAGARHVGWYRRT